jgi:predicted dehydrogenase
MREVIEHNSHRVLVVGVGSIGERHVRCFAKSGRARVSICEPNEHLREQVGQRYGIDDRFADLDSALLNPHDAAVIAVPADLHIPLALKAVGAGWHVLIEKPLSVTGAGIDEFQSLVRRKQVIAAVGYVYRAHPALDAMRAAIREGLFGRPLQLVVVAGQNFPTYRPAYRDSYYTNRAKGGGAIQDAMTHLINAAEWLVGPIDRVVADVAHQAIADVDVEDVVHLLARHGDVIASYSLNQFQAPNEVTITVICERGTARFEYHNNRWMRMTRPDEPWQAETVCELERDALFIRQAKSFLDAIEGRSAPLCTLEDGSQSLRVNLAILDSVGNRAWQAVEEPTMSFERKAV